MYATVSSGAANDLQQANLLAREAVEKWGLSPRVGQLISEHGLSEQMRAVVDEEVRRLVADAYRDAVALVREHEPQLRRIAESLLASGNIDRPEIELAMQGTIPVPRMPQVSHSPEMPHAATPDAAPGRIVDGRELFGRRRAGRLAGLRAAFSRDVR
jgi:cell division protease FtsH